MRGKIIRDGRLFGKISVVDILSVALVLVLAVTVYLRFSSTDETAADSNSMEVTYVLKISPVRDYTTNQLKVGDKLYVNEDDNIGEIVDIRLEDATQLTATLDGEMMEMPVEDRYAAFVTVKAKGRFANRCYYLTDEFEVALYNNIYFHTKYVVTSGTVMSIDATEGGG